MRQRLNNLAAVLVGLSAAVTGCGSSDDSPAAGAGGMAGSGGAAGSGGTAGLGGSAGQAVPFTFKYQLFAGDPIEGGMVALDRRDGTREEVVTDTEGEAVFEVDPSEIVSVIAYKASHRFAAMSGDRIVELGSTSVPLVDFTPAASNPVLATLSGSATGRVGTTLLVDPSGTSSYYQEDGAEFSVKVLENEPFALMGIDFSVPADPAPRTTGQTFHAWYAAELPGFSGNSSHDFDFSMSPSTTLVSGTVPMPSDPELRTQGSFYLQVMTGEQRSLALGFPSRTAPSDGAMSFDFDAEYIDMPSLSGGYPIVTMYQTGVPSGRVAWVLGDGPPVAGSNPVLFGSPPTITGRGGNHDAVGLSWHVGSHDEGIYAAYFAPDGAVYGSINLAARADEAVLPLLPSNVDETSLLVGATGFLVQTCPEVGENQQCDQGTQTKRVTLK